MVYFRPDFNHDPARLRYFDECITIHAQKCCVLIETKRPPLSESQANATLNRVSICLSLYVSAVGSNVSVFGRAKFGHTVGPRSVPRTRVVSYQEAKVGFL